MGWLVLKDVKSGVSEFYGDNYDWEQYKRYQGLPHTRLNGRKVSEGELQAKDKRGE